MISPNSRGLVLLVYVIILVRWKREIGDGCLQCLISKDFYIRFRSVGSQRPRMYGLSKVHKTGVALKPILSVIESVQLAKWSAELTQPVSNLLVLLSLQISLEISSENKLTMSFDIVIL